LGKGGGRLLAGGRFGPREPVGLASVTVAGKHGNRGVGDVVARHETGSTVPCGAPDNAVLVGEQRDGVEVHGVLQERPLQTATADVVFGGPVLAAEGEGAVGRGAKEG